MQKLERIFTRARWLTPTGIVDGALRARDGVIVALGPDAEKDADPAGERVDLRGALALPGLVNAHGHSAMTLVRGVGGGLPLQRWLEEAIFPIEAKMTADDIRAGMGWAILEMLASGTTCVADMYDFPEAGAEMLMASGLKANICRVGLDFPWSPGEPKGRLSECIAFVRDFHDPSGRVTADFCLHSEYLTREAFVRDIAEANADLKRPVHLHVSETEKEHAECQARHNGETPIAYFARLGLLDHGAYCAHCVYCTDADFDTMREKGASFVHNPTSNLKLASGFARTAAAAARGVNVALGTDGCASNDNLNMFEEMHLAALLAKGLARDPTVLPAAQVLEMATRNGARALGRTDTGMLAPGMKADFCVLDTDKPHLEPLLDPANIAVYSAQGSDVAMTVVDGEILYDHGNYPTLDAERLRFEFKAAVRRLGVVQ